VPLLVEEQVIGVLDMQANRANAFNEHNLTVFEAMATQLAISINSAQQWALAQEAQQKAQEAIRQLTRETWTEKLAARQPDRPLSVSYDLSAITPFISTGQASLVPATHLMAPLRVQNEPIGHLAVARPPEKGWSEEERTFLEAVAQQLSQKAETLRLFEESQQKAVREQIARQITDKVRASRDMEQAVKTAMQELTQALGVARVVVNLSINNEQLTINNEQIAVNNEQ
jgi:GAF domain-containing protein